MPMNSYSVPLKTVVEEFHLTVTYASTDFDRVQIMGEEVSRPGLQLTGFFNHFERLRLQVIGNVESAYMDTLPSERKREIFGELFFAIDPGYRGKAGEISTQYANLHADPDEKFYIPENVYIIGTMNDIDRSVDSFDFAMRRRFRFVELRADERLEMLALLEDEDLEAEAIRRMAALNKEIANVEDLNENYQIGASYFLKLKTLTFDQLWTDYLQPLLQEYVQGMYDEEGLMSRFAKAYGYQKPSVGDVNETTQNQG